jgi:hypothetical protein
MWDQPYLETCCRAALHRLYLSGSSGRPGNMADGACLKRLAAMGLCVASKDERYQITEAGLQRHQAEIGIPV